MKIACQIITNDDLAFGSFLECVVDQLVKFFELIQIPRFLGKRSLALPYRAPLFSKLSVDETPNNI